MNQDKLAARSIYLLKRVETIIKTELETALKEFGVTPGQYTTMSLLQADVECSSADLARRVAISAQSMSEMITLLERKELVERHEKPGNRRVLHVGLTAAGRRMLAACEKKADLVEAELFRPLGRDEMAALRRLLARIIGGARQQDV